MKDWMLLTILGGVLLLSIIIGLGVWLTSGSSYERVQSFKISATIKSSGNPGEASSNGGGESRKARNLRLYLDVSESMAGYLPTADGENTTGFRTVAHLVPDHLLRLYGPIETVSWIAVDDKLQTFEREPRFQTSEFRGGETYLDLAVADAIDALRNHEVEAAAIVTDLVATREVSGALGLYNAIREWLRSSEVQNAELDFGILGVRIPFRGVANGKCQALNELGCWYSERARAWQALAAPANRPFYILILGRSSLEGIVQSPSDSLVHRTGAALLGDIESLGFEGRWEMLTYATRPRPAELQCTAKDMDGNEQFTLLRNSELDYQCQQDKPVVFSCDLIQTDREIPVELKPTAVEVSWPQNYAGASLSDSAIKLHLDCSEIRRKKPEEPLLFTELEAKPSEPAAGWTDWSTESDESESHLDRTLQLRHFIAGTRPESFVVDVEEPLLRGKS